MESMVATRIIGVFGGLLALSSGFACGGSSVGCDPQDPASLDPFTSIDIDSAAYVELTVEPGSEQQVEIVEGSATTCVSDRVLYVNKTGDEWLTNVSVTLPEVDSINVKSASNLAAVGETDTYEISLSSASGASADGLIAQRVSVDFSKDSTGQINASDAIDGNVDGGSVLVVFGGADTSGVVTNDGTISTG